MPKPKSDPFDFDGTPLASAAPEPSPAALASAAPPAPTVAAPVPVLKCGACARVGTSAMDVRAHSPGCPAGAAPTPAPMPYVLKQITPGEGLWTSPEVFQAPERHDIAQAVTAGFLSGQARWAETPEGIFILGVDAKGCLMPRAPDVCGKCGVSADVTSITTTAILGPLCSSCRRAHHYGPKAPLTQQVNDLPAEVRGELQKVAGENARKSAPGPRVARMKGTGPRPLHAYEARAERKADAPKAPAAPVKGRLQGMAEALEILEAILAPESGCKLTKQARTAARVAIAKARGKVAP